MTFPQDCATGCPPADAIEGSGRVFRIVGSNPCQEADFLSFPEEGASLASSDAMPMHAVRSVGLPG